MAGSRDDLRAWITAARSWLLPPLLLAVLAVHGFSCSSSGAAPRDLPAAPFQALLHAAPGSTLAGAVPVPEMDPRILSATIAVTREAAGIVGAAPAPSSGQHDPPGHGAAGHAMQVCFALLAAGATLLLAAMLAAALLRVVALTSRPVAGWRARTQAAYARPPQRAASLLRPPRAPPRRRRRSTTPTSPSPPT